MDASGCRYLLPLIESSHLAGHRLQSAHAWSLSLLGMLEQVYQQTKKEA